MLGVALVLAVGFVIAWILGAIATCRLLTRPRKRAYTWALARGRPGDPSELDPPIAFESWTFRSRGRDLAAWRLPGRNQTGPLILVTHGWGESRTTLLPRLAALAGMVRGVIAWDLPGHGDSPGRSVLGAAEPDDLVELVRLIDEPVFLYGRSLGAGVSIAAARNPAIAPRVVGVIAEAPYRRPATPARAMLRVMGLPSSLNLGPALALVRLCSGRRWAGFDRAAHAAALTCPLLVIHGQDDPISPIEDGRAIAAAATRGTMLHIAAGDHDLDWTNDAPTSSVVEQWIKGCCS